MNGPGLGGIEILGAAGVWCRLADGRQVIDASNTAAPLGHGHADLVTAVRGASGSPAAGEGWVWPGRQRAAEDLLSYAFRGEESWVGAVRFFGSASEANDRALSLAQALTGRGALVTRERAHYGGRRPAPHLAEMRELPRPRCGVHSPHPGGGPCDCLPADLASTLADAAAVIIDYSQGGVYPAPAYQDLLARAAREAGALWVADEVVTGLGRQGRWMTFQRGAARPDLVTLGQGLAGGAAPAAAVVLSQRVTGMLEDQLSQSCSTLRGGHPVSVAAVSATLRRIDQDGLVERADSLDAVMRTRLTQIGSHHPSVRSVDGLGLHWTVELHGGGWRDSPADTSEITPAQRVLAAALDQGVLLAAGADEMSVFIAPPLIVSDAETDTILNALDHALGAADAVMAEESLL
jgi:4-aminobutyrate aminotransferase-like enzyme